jgi:hypothetical protein
MCDECEYYGWIGETKCPECGYNLALLTGAKREEIDWSESLADDFARESNAAWCEWDQASDDRERSECQQRAETWTAAEKRLRAEMEKLSNVVFSDGANVD